MLSYVVDKKNGIVDMVWSVEVELGGGVFFLVVLWCA